MQYEDILPTILAAAGADSSAVNTGCPDAAGKTGFDGRNALAALLGKTDRHRDYVFGQNTMLGINGVTSPYASRMVSDGHWKLIANYHADAIFPHADFGLAHNWKIEGEKGNTFAASQYARQAKHPATELYDLQTDPWELKNIAEQPENKEVITRLRAQLDAWLKQQGDNPMKTESEAYGRQPGHQKKTTALTAEEIAERTKQFERKDKNHDGKLSLEEYLGANPDKAAKARFNRWDTNTDGFLSLDEFISQGKKQVPQK